LHRAVPFRNIVWHIRSLSSTVPCVISSYRALQSQGAAGITALC
jgi:hypothetical protein